MYVFIESSLPLIFILSSGALLLGSIRAGVGPLLSGFYPTTKIVYHRFIESQAGQSLGVAKYRLYVSAPSRAFSITSKIRSLQRGR